MRAGALAIWGAGLLAVVAAGAVQPVAAKPAAQAEAGLAPDRLDAVRTAMAKAVERERALRGVPSLGWAIIGSGGILLSGASGVADKATGASADTATVYRAASITKLFTDMLVMQLVQEGRLSLDAPVRQYLPDFHPDRGPIKGEVTLRQLMAHRSGLVREAPVGSYFDDSEPSLRRTVASLNSTGLVAAPGTYTKYSNAGVAVVGRVLEEVTGKDYRTLVRERLLSPLRMTRSGFAKSEVARPAYAEMASFDGQRFEAPLFDLGTVSAGGLYTSVADLSQFARMLLNGGTVDGRKILPRDRLEEMWVPHYGRTTPYTFGIGFILDEFEGHRMVHHTGGIYGYTSALRVFPDDGFAVVALSAQDDSPATKRLSNYAASLVLAARAGRPLPVYEASQRLGRAEALRLAGRFEAGGESLFLRAVGDRLLLEAPRAAGEVRREGTRYYINDENSFNDALSIDAGGASVTFGGTLFRRTSEAKAPPLPDRNLQSLIGDYGWGHNYIRVYERDGKPFVRIEWTSFEAMRFVGRDALAFPEDGMYPLERLVFKRGPDGRAVSVDLNGISFPRRAFGKEADAQVRALINGDREGLRRSALAAHPPAEQGEFVAPDLVPLARVGGGLRFDVRYASSNNFMGFPVYDAACPSLQRPAAAALGRVAKALKPYGFGLTIHDAYRPWYVTKMFWDATPDSGKLFVADPAQGSRHNRGAAVDLTLHDLASGRIAEMPGDYDEMSSRSFPQYVGGTSRQRWRRDLLRKAMEAEGYQVFEAEWWHFDLDGWERFPLQNSPMTCR